MRFFHGTSPSFSEFDGDEDISELTNGGFSVDFSSSDADDE